MKATLKALRFPVLLPIAIIFGFLLIFLIGCDKTEDTKTNARFVRTVDGDTIIANIDGKEEYVRLLLIDTPETKHPKIGVQPFGIEASNFMNDLFSPDDPIFLKYGTELRDKYGRILAYVYMEDGQMVNELLLIKGLARVAYVFPPNDQYVDTFRRLEEKAKKQRLGIWSIEGYVQDYGFDTKAIEKK